MTNSAWNSAAYRDKVNNLKAQFNLARSSYRTACQELEAAECVLRHTRDAQELVQIVAQQVQQQAHNQIAGVVSRCLETVFDEPYEFKIHFERKRGKTEARLVFERDGFEVDPITASGGGVLDVASFALRLSCILLSRPKVRRVIIMDEPFKYVSQEYRGRVREMLDTLSTEMKMQFGMVTHIKELEMGKVIEL